MAQFDGYPTPQPEADDEALRRRLLKRVGAAAAVVVALLGGLALVEEFQSRLEVPPGQVARVEAPTRPIEKPAAEEKPEEEEEEKPADKAEGQPAGKPAEVAREEPAAEPERTTAPSGRAARVERPLTVPATGRPAIMRPGEPVAVAPRPEPHKEIARAVPAPARQREALAPAPAPAPASRPIARAVESARQFLVQVGVFSNLANAEELRAKLEGAGVPTHVEARVQVGPFASRQEAEQAREKLRTLGIEPGIVVTARK